MAFVEFNDVRKVYKMGEVEVAAADGMTFTAESGEFVVVVGPSNRARKLPLTHGLSRAARVAAAASDRAQATTAREPGRLCGRFTSRARRAR